MSEELKIIANEDGTFSEYDDTFDITIHCQSEEEQNEVLEKLNAPQPKMGYCKDCKYFEYDSVAEVHGIPLIVAHEICKRWGKGCQTREDGYCFLFEPQEGSDKE